VARWALRWSQYRSSLGMFLPGALLSALGECWSSSTWASGEAPRAAHENCPGPWGHSNPGDGGSPGLDHSSTPCKALHRSGHRLYIRVLLLVQYSAVEQWGAYPGR
jgi:hypothetical protein